MNFLIGRITNTLGRPLQNLAERLMGKNEMYRRMLDGHAERMRVAMPAQVVSFNASKQTIVAQPLIREKVIDRRSGAVQWLTLPQIMDVPVQFPQAGDFALTMPIEAGDEVLLVFADLCMDSWWTSGGVQNWNMRRRHDLSDAIAIPGINSVPNRIQNIASDAAELRTKDGSVSISLKTDQVSIKKGSDMKVELLSDKVALAFDANNKIEISTSGVAINGTLRINGVQYLLHAHTGVNTGPGTSGPVAI